MHCEGKLPTHNSPVGVSKQEVEPGIHSLGVACMVVAVVHDFWMLKKKIFSQIKIRNN
jgi:hypothetical protein